MNTINHLLVFLSLLSLCLLIYTCKQPDLVVLAVDSEETSLVTSQESTLALFPIERDSIAQTISITGSIKIKDYFDFIEEQVTIFDTLVPYSLTEHVLVHANPWLIDRLVDTDYYIRMERGEFVKDQKDLIILKQGDRLVVPDEQWANAIEKKLSETYVDINILEYKLWIKQADEILYEFPVRVGRNEIRYLETAGRDEDLRTRSGEGFIFKIVKNPIYLNPVNSKRYSSTLRDDKRRTQLPIIPFLHTEINGHRWGQLIHPTTNPKTLGKAYSNGCIGTSEAAAWLIYYHAPLYTTVVIRYDLEVINESGDTIILKDIYKDKPNL